MGTYSQGEGEFLSFQSLPCKLEPYKENYIYLILVHELEGNTDSSCSKGSILV
jgi:hypothetical protein